MSGKNVLITGGTGGMGKVIANKLSQNGYNTYTIGSEIDLSDQHQVFELMDKFTPDILIYAAGYIQPQQIKTSSVYQWKKEISVNLIGAYVCAKEAVNRGCETIINVSSTAASHGRNNWSGYCASKAGLVNFTQSLAEEGYNAYCISPGRTNTKMRRNLFPDEDPSTLLDPIDIYNVVVDILNGEYDEGSNISIKFESGRILREIR